MNTGMNLNRATVITLCEPVYDPKLYKQVLKRVHRLEQEEKMFVYVLFSDTIIEKYVWFRSRRVQDCRCDVRSEQAGSDSIGRASRSRQDLGKIWARRSEQDIWARSGQDIWARSGQDIWARSGQEDRSRISGQDPGRISGQDLGKISGQDPGNITGQDIWAKPRQEDSQADKYWQGK